MRNSLDAHPTWKAIKRKARGVFSNLTPIQQDAYISMIALGDAHEAVHLLQRLITCASWTEICAPIPPNPWKKMVEEIDRYYLEDLCQPK